MSANASVDDPGEAAAPQPPTRERVARRALVLAALAWRGWLEIRRPADADAQVEASRAWAERQGLFDEAEQRERELLCAPFGCWTERDLIGQGWAMEAGAVLAWALQLDDLPADDVKSDAHMLSAAVGLFAPEPVALAAQLRPQADIAELAAQPLPKPPEGAAGVAHSIAMERHRAAAWLMGVSPRWSEVDLAACVEQDPRAGSSEGLGPR